MHPKRGLGCWGLGAWEPVSGSEDRSINTQTAGVARAGCGSESSVREEGTGSPEKSGLAKANGSRGDRSRARRSPREENVLGEQGLMHKDLWVLSRCGWGCVEGEKPKAETRPCCLL